MPYPYLQDCADSVSAMHSAAGQVSEALTDVVQRAGKDTWAGGKADEWFAELTRRQTDVTREMDGLQSVAAAMRAEASRLLAADRARVTTGD